jgi:hypothetical protein
MSAPLLIAVSLAYLWVAGSYFMAGRLGMSLAFLAYTIANIGFILDGWRQP